MWSESNLGLSAGALPNNAVATGWLAFPAGEYDFSFTPPAFQPEDLTHVRSIINRGFACANSPSNDRASSFSIAVGILPFDAQDGNAYQNVLISTTGIGSVPNPASNSSFDWIWLQRDCVPGHQFTGQIANFVSDALNDVQCQTRAMRKLSHGTGLLWCIGWDWDDPTFSQNGDTLQLTIDATARTIFKEP